MYSGFKDLRVFSKETKDSQKPISTLGKSAKKISKVYADKKQSEKT